MNERSEHLPVVGIDLGATNMLLGIIGADNQIIARRHTKTEGEKGVSHVLEKLISEVQGICDDAGLKTENRGGDRNCGRRGGGYRQRDRSRCP